MFSLLDVLKQYAHILLFLLLEVICFILIINFNQKQKEIFLHSSSLFSGSLLEQSARMGDYMSLYSSNDDLIKENARLLERLMNLPPEMATPIDSQLYQYDVLPARVMSNTILSLRNRITIDKGSDEGVAPGMGAISSHGLVGIIDRVSASFATIIPMIHLDSRISATPRGSNFFGTVLWKGMRYDHLQLEGIPIHADIRVGDLVETNGFSTIFPTGIPIGSIKRFKVSKDGTFFDIVIIPTQNFSELGHLYILSNQHKVERTALQNE